MNSIIKTTNKIPNVLSVIEEKDLIKRIKSFHYPDDIKKLTHYFYPLIITLARKVPNYSIMLPDLIQEGWFGLIKAIEYYDSDSPYRFSTLASHYIRGNFYKFIYREFNHKKLVYYGDQDYITYSSFSDEKSLVNSKTSLDIIYSSLKKMDERSQKIIFERYLASKKASLKKLAIEYKISPERVRQIEFKAKNIIKQDIVAKT